MDKVSFTNLKLKINNDTKSLMDKRLKYFNMYLSLIKMI